MTQDEIIEMAEFCFEKSKNQTEFIQLFAKLVAEHERRACAKVCEEMALHLFDKDKVVLQVAAEYIRARGN
jgi:Fe-S-cluster-containing hydrogenase component 2